MKKKVLSLAIILSVLFVGSVSAASLWGTYKGKQIIRLTVDGVPVKVSDAPAVSMDDRTMIPIYLLQQAGINYTWDQKNQTVDVKKNNTNTTSNIIVISKSKYKEIQDKVIKYGGTNYQYSYAGEKPFVEVYYHAGSDANVDIDNMAKISTVFLDLDIGVAEFIYYVDNKPSEMVYILRNFIEDYASGKIDRDEYLRNWTITQID